MSQRNKTNCEGPSSSQPSFNSLLSKHLEEVASKPDWELVIMPKPQKDWLIFYHAGERIGAPRQVDVRRDIRGIVEQFELFKKSLALTESATTMCPEMNLAFQVRNKITIEARAIENPDGSLTLKKPQ